MIKWKIQITITEFHLILMLIAGLHILSLGLKSNNQYLVTSNTEEEKDLTKKKLKDKKYSDEESLAGVGGSFRRRPFVITYMGDTKAKQYSALLNLLQKKTNNTLLKSSGMAQVGFSVNKGTKEVSLEQKDFVLTDLQKKGILKRLLKEKMGRVEICKKSHLLKDEFLIGAIKVNMKIKTGKNTAIPHFVGQGNISVIQSLESCVKGELASISFPNEFKDQEISFDLKIN